MDDQACRYDVFMSLSGADRAHGRRIVKKLRALGLRVFLDEDEIPQFRSITGEIERALSASKIFLSLYSKSYPERPSCQLELTAAFLAGQARGDPTERILIINPEDNADHILPAELADARYLPAAMGDSAIAKRVRNWATQLSGPIGTAVAAHRLPPHYGRVPGVPAFVGRYREMWSLHSILHAPDLPLTQGRTHGSVARVVGIPGIGKSSLVAAYAVRFGAAFPGGVFWTTLAGATTGAARPYQDQLLSIAGQVRVALDDQGARSVRGALATYFARHGLRALWIVDGVPPASGDSIVHDLVLPGAPTVRTILIGDGDNNSSIVPTLQITGLTSLDGGRLLDIYREPQDPADRWAQQRIVAMLDGHAGALTEVGVGLREIGSSRPYETMLRRLTGHQESPLVAGELRQDLDTSLTAKQRFVLSVTALHREEPVQIDWLLAMFRLLELAGEDGDPVAALEAAIDGLCALSCPRFHGGF